MNPESYAVGAAFVTGVLGIGAALVTGSFLLLRRGSNDRGSRSLDPGELRSGEVPVTFWEQTIRRITAQTLEQELAGVVGPKLDLIAVKVDTMSTKIDGVKAATESLGPKVDLMIVELKRQNGGRT